MVSIEVERVGESAVVYQEGVAIMMMPLHLATQLGSALMQVATLGDDVLDEPIDGP